MLFLWLFGLGASVANACLIGPAGTAGPCHAVASMAPEHEGTADAQTDRHGTVATTNCQDFCGKATVSIPTQKPSFGDVALHAAFTSAAGFVLPAPARASVQPWMPRRDGVKAPPIPIAFLRLAL